MIAAIDESYIHRPWALKDSGPILGQYKISFKKSRRIIKIKNILEKAKKS
jgi:hypothetical protein